MLLNSILLAAVLAGSSTFATTLYSISNHRLGFVSPPHLTRSSSLAPNLRAARPHRPEERLPLMRLNAEKTYKVKLVDPEGKESTVNVKEDEYILDAAEDQGVELPYSCRGGSCSSCTGKMVTGKVDNSEQSFFDDSQMKEGYVLLCTAYAKSDCEIKTHLEGLIE